MPESPNHNTPHHTQPDPPYHPHKPPCASHSPVPLVPHDQRSHQSLGIEVSKNILQTQLSVWKGGWETY
jgi:hypothetical protein